jgi:hypothetical protein
MCIQRWKCEDVCCFLNVGWGVQGMFNKQVSLTCNFCVNHIIFRWEVALVGVACNRWCNSQSSAIHGISWCAVVTALEAWSHEEFSSVVWFLCVRHIFPTEVYHQLIVMYGCSIMGVQHVKKWCRDLGNGWRDVHDNDYSGLSSTSRMDAKARSVEELILENQWVTTQNWQITSTTIMRKWKCLFMNCCKGKDMILPQ